MRNATSLYCFMFHVGQWGPYDIKWCNFDVSEGPRNSADGAGRLARDNQRKHCLPQFFVTKGFLVLVSDRFPRFLDGDNGHGTRDAGENKRPSPDVHVESQRHHSLHSGRLCWRWEKQCHRPRSSVSFLNYTLALDLFATYSLLPPWYIKCRNTQLKIARFWNFYTP